MATSLSVHSLFSSTRSIIYFSFLFDSIFHFVCLLASDVDVHLELGMQLLMKGQLNDALSHYHLAVESDSSNYLTYFKRSTVYQAMNRHKSALDDLNECLKLNENFLPARLQKATILYRQAVFDQALKEIEFILQMDPFNDDARLFHTNLDIMRNEENQAKQLIEWKRFSEAIPILDRLNQEHFLGYRFRELRALCYENIGDIINAINDLRAVTKMKSDDTDGYYKLSQLHYSLGEPDESLNAIRECLKLDPDHKECHKYYKKVKKLANFYKTGHEYASQHNYPTVLQSLNLD
ncbi:DnaJ -like protein subfamily C member 3 [Sarcoptes scabiei]|nr:DnaJ -like protein subfamily C member 3 [Sarcoptes scabiei]